MAPRKELMQLIMFAINQNSTRFGLCVVDNDVALVPIYLYLFCDDSWIKFDRGGFSTIVHQQASKEQGRYRKGEFFPEDLWKEL